MCPDCGSRVEGGRAACHRLFEEVLAREYGDFRLARLHRLTVDTYALQHPDRYMRTAKSFAAHLTGLFAAVESDSATATNRAVQRWLNGPTTLERPTASLPAQRGALTIAFVHAASEADQHLIRVRAWAEATWDAWRAFHPVAKAWALEAQQAFPST